MKTIEEQIEDLRQQIHTLENQIREQNKEKILPFLREHATLVWDGYSRMEVTFDSPESEKKAIKLLEDVEGSGYHMGAEVAEMTYFRYDDGRITFSVHVNGPTEIGVTKIVDAVVGFGLKLTFDKAMNETRLAVAREEKKLTRLKELKERYLNATKP